MPGIGLPVQLARQHARKTAPRTSRMQKHECKNNDGNPDPKAAKSARCDEDLTRDGLESVPLLPKGGIAEAQGKADYLMWHGQIEGTDIVVLDPRFEACFPGHVRVERLWTGARWAEGPAWFAAGRYLVWSDIPNNRMMRLVEPSDEV